MDEDEKQLREALEHVAAEWERARRAWMDHAFPPEEDPDLHQATLKARQVIDAHYPNLEREDPNRATLFITSLAVYRQGLKGLKEDFGFELPPDLQEEIEARLAELPRDPLA